MKFDFNEDAWIHVTPLGEFAHAGAGVVQVIDSEALKAITDDFKAKAGTENFPGLLVDFDHFSMDTDKPSEAAGWISALRADAEGLWAKVRWTSKGRESVEGGEYRLVSPVFPKPSLCEDLGENRIRPRQLQSVALTNEPNIKGARPLTNREPHSIACALSDSPADTCVCACGGSKHGDGIIDDEGANEAPKITISSIRTNGGKGKFVSFIDEEGRNRYLQEGESEDGYEAVSVDEVTGEAQIKLPSGETVTLKTDDIPKKEVPPAGPPGGPPGVPPRKVPPVKADPKKKLTGVQKWMLGEMERKRKNDERKAAAKERLKQLNDQRREDRYKLKSHTPVTSSKTGSGTGKSFISKPVIPKSRYYIDGAWYDNSGTFISRNKPATSLRNRSGDEKPYKWVFGATKSGTHCPDCTSRAGKVKSIAAWKAMGKPPCKCKCKLVPTKGQSANNHL